MKMMCRADVASLLYKSEPQTIHFPLAIPICGAAACHSTGCCPYITGIDSTPIYCFWCLYHVKT